MNPWERLIVVPVMRTDLKTGQGSRLQSGSRPIGILLRIAGTGLLWATAGLHLDLYLTGYRTIPTIGWLFLLQIIAAFALGALFLVTARTPRQVSSAPATWISVGRSPSTA